MYLHLVDLCSKLRYSKYTIHGSYGGRLTSHVFSWQTTMGALMINSSWEENRPTAPMYKDLGDPLSNLYITEMPWSWEIFYHHLIVLGNWPSPVLGKLMLITSYHIMNMCICLSLNKTSLVYSIPDISGGVVDLGHLVGGSWTLKGYQAPKGNRIRFLQGLSRMPPPPKKK